MYLINIYIFYSKLLFQIINFTIYYFPFWFENVLDVFNEPLIMLTFDFTVH